MQVTSLITRSSCVGVERRTLCIFRSLTQH